MNLKEAAHRLGVHYQTAYKWVRSGDLAAVRVGGRYDISVAAIERCQARKEALVDSLAPPRPQIAGALSRDDVLEELEATATDPILERGYAARLVTRRGAETIGESCIAIGFERGRLAFAEVADENPAQAAFVGSAYLLFRPPGATSGNPLSAFSQGRIVRLGHVPQDLLRAEVPPEFRQHLARFPVQSLLSVPVFSDGTLTGALSFTRGRAGQPYSDEDEAYALELSSRFGTLIETAMDGEAAVRLRQAIVERLSALVNATWTGTPPTTTALDHLLDACDKDRTLPAAILGPDRAIVAVNRSFAAARNELRETIPGSTTFSHTHPGDSWADELNFRQLVTGTLDFGDMPSRRVLPDGTTLPFYSHRAAVRAPDASVRYLVTVARQLRCAPSDFPAASYAHTSSDPATALTQV